MRRFLVKFSYFGTYYKEFLHRKSSDRKPFESVVGTLQAFLMKLHPGNDVVFVPAVVTDTGVHALMNYGHVDLMHREKKREYAEDAVKWKLNDLISKHNHDILIHDVKIVPDCFHAQRDIKNVHYLYRLCIQNSSLTKHIPIVEKDRCSVIRDLFYEDMNLEASALLNQFKFSSVLLNDKQILDNFQLSVSAGSGLLDSDHDLLYKNLQFIDLSLICENNLNSQVRRILGALIAVAVGKITVRALSEMLATGEFWHARIEEASPEGLYLKHVTFKDC